MNSQYIKDFVLERISFEIYFFQSSSYRYEESINNFQKAQKLLRGNKFVDYKQLGFSFKLFECEVNEQVLMICLFIYSNLNWTALKIDIIIFLLWYIEMGLESVTKVIKDYLFNFNALCFKYLWFIISLRIYTFMHGSSMKGIRIAFFSLTFEILYSLRILFKCRFWPMKHWPNSDLGTRRERKNFWRKPMRSSRRRNTKKYSAQCMQHL